MTWLTGRPSWPPHDDAAERMLGVVNYDREGPADLLLKEYAESLGQGDTYTPTRVGVFLGEAGKTRPVAERMASPKYGPM